MKTVRASEKYLPQMTALWQRCFSDEENYVNQYFERFGAEHGVLCLEGDTLCAMAQWLSVPYVQPDGETQSGAYLYAVCTDPAFRRQGLCRAVCLFAETYLKTLGCDFVFLRPASASLAAMYETFGYQMTLTVSETTASAQSADGVSFCALSPQDYGMYRQMLLRGGFMDWQADALAYQASQGELLSVTKGDAFAIAAVCDGMCKEFLGERALAGALAAHYGAAELLCRMQGPTPFAMAKALSGKPLPTGYSGFVFD